MNLKDFINQFYFDMTIHELQLMNSKPHIPDITYNSLLYLDIISYKENCTVSFLADAMNVSKSAVTIKVNELIKQGFVIKTQSETDKRVFHLKLNKQVVEEYQVYDRKLMSSIQGIEEKYSQKDIDLFCEMLGMLSNGYSETIEQE